MLILAIYFVHNYITVAVRSAQDNSVSVNHFVLHSTLILHSRLVMGRCRFFKLVSIFGFLFGFFKVGSVFGIGFSKYRDIGVGFRLFVLYAYRTESTVMLLYFRILYPNNCGRQERKLRGDKGGRSPRKFEVGGMEVLISPQYFNKNYNISVKFPPQ